MFCMSYMVYPFDMLNALIFKMVHFDSPLDSYIRMTAPITT